MKKKLNLCILSFLTDINQKLYIYKFFFRQNFWIITIKIVYLLCHYFIIRWQIWSDLYRKRPSFSNLMYEPFFCFYLQVSFDRFGGGKLLSSSASNSINGELKKSFFFTGASQLIMSSSSLDTSAVRINPGSVDLTYSSFSLSRQLWSGWIFWISS